MASPHIAGVVALLLESGIQVANIKTQIQSTADKTSPRNDLNRYGAGLVNVYAALSCGSISCSIPTPSPTPTLVLTETTVVSPVVVVAPTTPAPTAPTVTPEPAPIVAVPTVSESLQVTVAKKRKLTVSVTAPTGSKTWVQRKSGKKWKTVLKITTTPSVVIKLGRSGTYRVQVIAPNEKVISKSYKVK
jgi:hypothetical protein